DERRPSRRRLRCSREARENVASACGGAPAIRSRLDAGLIDVTPRRTLSQDFISAPAFGGSMITTEEKRGIVNLQSNQSFSATVEQLSKVLRAHGMTIFARIDQKAAAEAAGLTMPPMMLFLFGNPKAGTPLMLAHPSIAIDLPLKALVWEDESDQVWVSYN